MIVRPTRRQILAAGVATAALAPAGLNAQLVGQSRIIGQRFTGTRNADGSGIGGGTAIVATTDMLVRDCQFADFGDGVVVVDIALRNVTIEDCTATNSYRFLKNWSQQHPDMPASITGFIFRRIRADRLKRGFMRILYDSSGGVIEDVQVRGSAYGASYCVGFALDDTVNDVVYRRAEAHDFVESTRPDDRYWNGDGFSDERGNRHIRYYSCIATGCGDGGFDTKSAGVHLQSCLARGNKRNYRLWNSGYLKDCRSEDPFKRGGTGEAAHFSFSGDTGPVYILDRPIVRASAGNQAPVFFFQNEGPRASIAIYNADIVAPDAPLLQVVGPEPSIRWHPPREQQKILVARPRY